MKKLVDIRFSRLLILVAVIFLVGCPEDEDEPVVHYIATGQIETRIESNLYWLTSLGALETYALDSGSSDSTGKVVGLSIGPLRDLPEEVAIIDVGAFRDGTSTAKSSPINALAFTLPEATFTGGECRLNSADNIDLIEAGTCFLPTDIAYNNNLTTQYLGELSPILATSFCRIRNTEKYFATPRGEIKGTAANCDNVLVPENGWHLQRNAASAFEITQSGSHPVQVGAWITYPSVQGRVLVSEACPALSIENQRSFTNLSSLSSAQRDRFIRMGANSPEVLDIPSDFHPFITTEIINTGTEDVVSLHLGDNIFTYDLSSLTAGSYNVSGPLLRRKAGYLPTSKQYIGPNFDPFVTESSQSARCFQDIAKVSRAEFNAPDGRYDRGSVVPITIVFDGPITDSVPADAQFRVQVGSILKYPSYLTGENEWVDLQDEFVSFDGSNTTITANIFVNDALSSIGPASIIQVELDPDWMGDSSDASWAGDVREVSFDKVVPGNFKLFAFDDPDAPLPGYRHPLFESSVAPIQKVVFGDAAYIESMQQLGVNEGLTATFEVNISEAITPSDRLSFIPRFVVEASPLKVRTGVQTAEITSPNRIVATLALTEIAPDFYRYKDLDLTPNSRGDITLIVGTRDVRDRSRSPFSHFVFADERIVRGTHETILTFDVTKPTALSQTSINYEEGSDTATVSFRFDEPVELDISAFAITGAGAEVFEITGSGTSEITLTLSGLSGQNAELSISLIRDNIADLSGNPLADTELPLVSVDLTTEPRPITLSLVAERDSDGFCQTEPAGVITFTGRFNKNITKVTADDFELAQDVVQGDLSLVLDEVNALSDREFQATVLFTGENIEANLTLNLKADTDIEDDFGLQLTDGVRSLPADGCKLIVPGTAPLLTSQSSTYTLGSDAAIFTFEFSEALALGVDFSVTGDLTVTATLTEDANVITIQVTELGTQSGALSVMLNSTTIQDLNGNVFDGSVSETISVDAAPVLVSSTDNYTIGTGSFQTTFTFSESVSVSNTSFKVSGAVATIDSVIETAPGVVTVTLSGEGLGMGIGDGLLTVSAVPANITDGTGQMLSGSASHDITVGSLPTLIGSADDYAPGAGSVNMTFSFSRSVNVSLASFQVSGLTASINAVLETAPGVVTVRLSGLNGQNGTLTVFAVPANITDNTGLTLGGSASRDISLISSASIPALVSSTDDYTQGANSFVATFTFSRSVFVSTNSFTVTGLNATVASVVQTAPDVVAVTVSGLGSQAGVLIVSAVPANIIDRANQLNLRGTAARNITVIAPPPILTLILVSSADNYVIGADSFTVTFTFNKSVIVDFSSFTVSGLGASINSAVETTPGVVVVTVSGLGVQTGVLSVSALPNGVLSNTQQTLTGGASRDITVSPN